MIPRWKEETFAIILVKKIIEKWFFFRRVTAISVYVVGDVTILTDARTGALMGTFSYFSVHLMFLYNFAQGRPLCCNNSYLMVVGLIPPPPPILECTQKLNTNRVKINEPPNGLQ